MQWSTISRRVFLLSILFFGGINGISYAATTISGTITGDNGQALANVPIEIRTSSGWISACNSYSTTQGTTDNYGEYSIEIANLGTYFVKAGGSTYGRKWYAGFTGTPDCNQAESIGITELDVNYAGRNIQLLIAATIEGRVTNSSGGGISDLPITAHLTNWPCQTNTTAETFTDSNGDYRLTGLSPETYTIRTETWNGHPYPQEWSANGGSVTDCNDASMLLLTAGHTASQRDFLLELGGTISGTVYLSDGNAPGTTDGYVPTTSGPIPVTGIKLSILPFNEACRGWGDFSTYTDSTGEYIFTDVPPGTYALFIDDSTSMFVKEWWADGASVQSCGAAESFIIHSEQNLTGKDLQLEGGGSISGRITDINNLPLQNVTIHINQNFYIPCQTNWYGHGYTDSEGYYTIPGIPVGSYRLYGYSYQGNYIPEYYHTTGDGYSWGSAEPIEITWAGEAQTGKNIQLDPGGSISGAVTDTLANPLSTTVHKIRVSAYEKIGTDGCILTQTYGYNINTDGTYLIDGLPPNKEYFVTIQPDYNTNSLYQPQWQRDATTCEDAHAILVGIEAKTGKNFILEIGATVSGTVTNEDGTPLSGFKVGAYNTTSGCDLYNAWSLGYTPATTSATGSYEITGLAEGEYYIDTPELDYYGQQWWSSNGTTSNCTQATKRTVPHQTTVEDTDMQINKGGKISGTVFQQDGTTPVSLQNPYVMFYTGDPCADPILYDSSTSLDYCEGTYQSDAIAPGTYYVVLGQEYNITSPPSAWWAASQTMPSCSGIGLVTVKKGVTTFDIDFFSSTSYLFGDVNGDGVVDLVDTILYLQIMTGASPSPVFLQKGDLNGNGLLDMEDTLRAFQELQ